MNSALCIFYRCSHHERKMNGLGFVEYRRCTRRNWISSMVFLWNLRSMKVPTVLLHLKKHAWRGNQRGTLYIGAVCRLRVCLHLSHDIVVMSCTSVHAGVGVQADNQLTSEYYNCIIRTAWESDKKDMCCERRQYQVHALGAVKWFYYVVLRLSHRNSVFLLSLF